MIKINSVFKQLSLVFIILVVSCSPIKYNIKMYDGGKLIESWDECTLNRYVKVTDNCFMFDTKYGESTIISGGAIIISTDKNDTYSQKIYNDSLKITYNELIILADSLKHEIKYTTNKYNKIQMSNKLKEIKKDIRFITNQYWKLYHKYPNE